MSALSEAETVVRNAQRAASTQRDILNDTKGAEAIQKAKSRLQLLETDAQNAVKNLNDLKARGVK